jgi:hypothetical protein
LRTKSLKYSQPNIQQSFMMFRSAEYQVGMWTRAAVFGDVVLAVDRPRKTAKALELLWYNERNKTRL